MRLLTVAFLAMVAAASLVHAAPYDICFVELDQDPAFCSLEGNPEPCEVFRILRNLQDPTAFCCFPGADCCPCAAACNGAYAFCGTGETVTLGAPCIDSDFIPTPPVGWAYWLLPFDPNPQVCF